jgi:hypothetical protein
MTKNPFIIVLAFLPFFQTCVSTNKISYVEKYGYIENVEATDKNIEEYARKWNIDSSELYILDVDGYKKEIWSYNEENKKLTHDLYQWHQLMIYDKDGSIISYQLNCRTKVKNNDWQFDAAGTFDSFPPSDNTLVRFNKDLKLGQLSPYYINLSGVPLSDESAKNYSFTIVVYWSIYHGRQSENLINVVKDYQKANPEENIKYVFVNNDRYL